VAVRVQEIRTRMESQGLGLREAADLLQAPAAAVTGAIDWPDLVERFRKHKVEDTGDVAAATFEAVYRPVMVQINTTMVTKPIPRDGRALLAALRDRYGGEPGSRGRQIRIQHAAQLLRYAVKELGHPDRWLPPDDLVAFVGKRPKGSSRNPATPVKDHQLVRLLEGIPDPRWRLAVGLLACFGLRPVELKYCRVTGDKLYVGYEKRTARGSSKPGEVNGLDPVGMPGESVRLLRLLESGLIELPPLGNSDRATAMAIRQYLERRPAWRALKGEAAAAVGKLSPYSFRHGYALRAHELYGLSPRTTAALMRHSLLTHSAHYGHWTDSATIDEAVNRGIVRLSHGIVRLSR
jgi:integrase